MGKRDGRLAAAETGAKLSKDALEARLPALRVDLLNGQFDLQERAEFPVVVLLGYDDPLGGDAVFDRLHEWMDARLIVGTAYGPLAEEERERPRFWRYWRALPPRGRIGLLLGAYATRAVAERMRGELDPEGFEGRLACIRNFERALAADGALVLKFWLHLSAKEHARRLKEADRNDETWRYDEGELALLERAEEGLPIVEELLEGTDAPHAPWIVVDAEDPQHRDLAVARAIRDALGARLGTRPPAPPPAEPREPVTGEGALSGIDLSATLERDEYEKRKDDLQERVGRLSRAARRAGVSSVLAFEGWDAAGKGGAIRRLTRPISARDVRIVPIAAPTEEERAHHYLWRFWRQLPRAGHMQIFDRSWYGRVLVERVEGLAREEEWRRAYAEIVDFEDQLVERGVVLCKFWLHLDPDEQLRRFEAREQTPYKKYKITAEDYRNRRRWDDYVAAAEEMVARTHTERAPWTLVSANDKRWARVRVLEVVCDALERSL